METTDTFLSPVSQTFIYRQPRFTDGSFLRTVRTNWVSYQWRDYNTTHDRKISLGWTCCSYS